MGEDGYEPSDLTIPNVEMRYNQWSLRAEASTKLEEMFAAAQKDDVYLVMGSGYRGEDFQSVLYNSHGPIESLLPVPIEKTRLFPIQIQVGQILNEIHRRLRIVRTSSFA